ncbi:hypothetical protein GCM10007928_48620 [Sulfitobacter porphyrae]|nr:hypothetical protein GCM10007928_48620 [Sulfitobacter porphyrae]
MASYHLSVKTIKRSAGRSATAAAAYRVGERIECQREGRIHDYTRKQGIEETFILTPKDAPDWATDRSRLWNEVEASETRRNSVTAREWELALPPRSAPRPGRRSPATLPRSWSAATAWPSMLRSMRRTAKAISAITMPMF